MLLRLYLTILNVNIENSILLNRIKLYDISNISYNRISGLITHKLYYNHFWYKEYAKGNGLKIKQKRLWDTNILIHYDYHPIRKTWCYCLSLPRVYCTYSFYTTLSGWARRSGVNIISGGVYPSLFLLLLLSQAAFSTHLKVWMMGNVLFMRFAFSFGTQKLL